MFWNKRTMIIVVNDFNLVELLHKIIAINGIERCYVLYSEKAENTIEKYYI